MEMMTADEIYARVYADYISESVELSGAYFEFEVKAKKKDIIIAYARLQEDLNGDDVVQILPEGEVIDHYDERFAAEGFDEIYEGDCEAFLCEVGTYGCFKRYNEDEECSFVF